MKFGCMFVGVAVTLGVAPAGCFTAPRASDTDADSDTEEAGDTTTTAAGVASSSEETGAPADADSSDSADAEGSTTGAIDDDTTGTTGDTTGPILGTDSSSGSSDGGSSSTGEPFVPVRIAMFGTDLVGADLQAEGGEATVRASADAICGASLATNYPDLECSNVHAFLTVEVGDEVLDMQDNYDIPNDLPIEGPTGTLIDNDFASLLDHSVLIDLSDAVVFEDVASGWDFWSGSNSAGGAVPRCEDWTSTDVGD
ncbi:MAG: hypothetical protein AAF721_41380, partial [Myxococcota bacterium]